ncbi:lipopolysaccharide transport periplasmic protein LptA [Mailhella massiliensis]|uniref:lipopolysaccharide transport periplasmic protein LptA n=1 Tax=Mailhella massiliensis TaxID=1903261 RepID=UPI002352405B|nr:lipopolysaccharide transport periplasmic protein LptA [Mailhella massiliensis]
MKKALLSLLIVAFCATCAAAAPMPGGDSNLPVDVTADTMVYNADKNTVVFQGKVEAVRGEFKMWSELLTLYLTSKNDTGKEKNSAAPAMEGSDLDRIVAEKNVRFQNGTQTGSAQKATYYSAKSLLVLEGNPVLHDGDNSIKGNVIRYYVNENRSVVEGSPRQRVHAVFSSNDKKGK